MNAQMTIIRRAMAKSLRRLAVLPALLALGYSTLTTASVTLPDQLIGETQRFLEQAVADYLQRSAIQARHEVQINRLDPRLRLPPVSYTHLTLPTKA